MEQKNASEKIETLRNELKSLRTQLSEVKRIAEMTGGQLATLKKEHILLKEEYSKLKAKGGTK